MDVDSASPVLLTTSASHASKETSQSVFVPINVVRELEPAMTKLTHI